VRVLQGSTQNVCQPDQPYQMQIRGLAKKHIRKGCYMHLVKYRVYVFHKEARRNTFRMHSLQITLQHKGLPVIHHPTNCRAKVPKYGYIHRKSISKRNVHREEHKFQITANLFALRSAHGKMPKGAVLVCHLHC
jgi:hypothetical protein